MHSRIQETENRATALIQALRISGWPAQKDLADRLLRCRQVRADRRRGVQPQPQWPWLCRSPACESCRRRLVRHGCARAAAYMAHADNDACHMVTIALMRGGTLEDMRAVITGFRAEIRNLRDRRARADGRWRSLAMVGQVEIEPLGVLDIPLLPPGRRAVAEVLPVRGDTEAYVTHDQAVGWMGHVHLVCHAPELSGDELRAALERQWPGPAGRVDVRPLHPGCAAENTGAIMGYASKCAMRTKFRDGIEEPWAVAVQAAYWGWLHGLRRGLATLRVRLGPKRGRLPKAPHRRLAADGSMAAPAAVC
jgi:hypothetical protein